MADNNEINYESILDQAFGVSQEEEKLGTAFESEVDKEPIKDLNVAGLVDQAFETTETPSTEFGELREPEPTKEPPSVTTKTGIDRGAEAGFLAGIPIEQSEIDTLAKQHGVPIEDVQFYVKYLSGGETGLTKETGTKIKSLMERVRKGEMGETEAAVRLAPTYGKEVLGELGKFTTSFLYGDMLIPKMIHLAFKDDNYKKMAQDVDSLVSSRRSWLRAGSTSALQFGIPAGPIARAMAPGAKLAGTAGKLGAKAGAAVTKFNAPTKVAKAVEKTVAMTATMAKPAAGSAAIFGTYGYFATPKSQRWEAAFQSALLGATMVPVTIAGSAAIGAGLGGLVNKAGRKFGWIDESRDAFFKMEKKFQSEEVTDANERLYNKVRFKEELSDEDVDILKKQLNISDKAIKREAVSMADQGTSFAEFKAKDPELAKSFFNQAKKELTKAAIDDATIDFAKNFLQGKRIGAKFGTLTGAGLAFQMKTKEGVEQILDSDIIKLIDSKYTDRIKYELSRGKVERATGILRRQLLSKVRKDVSPMGTLKEADAYLDESYRLLGKDETALKNLFIDYRFQKFAERNISKSALGLDEGSTRTQETLRKIIRYFSPPHNKLAQIDRTRGTSTQPLFYDGIQKTMQARYHIDQIEKNVTQKWADGFYVSAKKLGKDLDMKEFARYIDAKDQEKDYFIQNQKMRTFVQRHAESYKKLNQRLVEEAEAAGIRIDTKQNYIKHQKVEVNTAMARFTYAIDELGVYKTKDAGGIADLSVLEFANKIRKDKNLAELVEAVKFLGKNTGMFGKKSRIRSGATLAQAIDKINLMPKHVLSKKLAPTIGAAFRRSEGAIPFLFREYDPAKLAASWVNNTIRAAYVREPVNRLSALAEILDKKSKNRSGKITNEKLYEDAEYIKGVIRQGILGIPARSQDYVKALHDKELRLLQKFGNDSVKVAQTKEMASNMSASFSAVMYQGLLGDPAKALRNLEQVSVLTAPEISGPYGQKLALESTAAIAALYGKAGVGKVKDLVTGKFRAAWNDPQKLGEIADDLTKRGFLPTKYRGELIDAAATGKSVSGAIRKGAEGLAHAKLYLFGKADIINRLRTVDMSHRLVKDYRRGVKEAVNYIDNTLMKTDPGVARRVKTILEKADTATAGDEMAKHLIARTQFHYSKATMGEGVRQWNSLYTMFTRWPMEISGDLVNKLQAGQAAPAMQKLLGPLGYLYLLDNHLENLAKRNGEFARSIQVFPGKRGFQAHAPITNLLSLTPEGATPFVIDTALNSLKFVGGSEMDQKAAAKELNRLLMSVTPGFGETLIYEKYMQNLFDGRVSGAYGDIYQGLQREALGVSQSFIRGRKKTHELIRDTMDVLD